MPPTPKHLATVVERMKTDGLRAVLDTAFQPERTAQSVAAEAGGAAVRMAHQPDSVPGTATYLDMLAFNVILNWDHLDAGKAPAATPAATSAAVQ